MHHSCLRYVNEQTGERSRKEPSPHLPDSGSRLRREVGLAGAVLVGLGSMVGTGVLVSIGIAAGVAGPSLLGATVLVALTATDNGLSSAQLAAAHPVSGGTYEYGCRWLSPAFACSIPVSARGS